jgi:hypothetical protein
MAGKSSARSRRNSPYVLDEMFIQTKRSAAGVLWRFRTETLILASVVTAFDDLARVWSALWVTVIMTGLIGTLLGLPWTRRFIIRRAWCVLSRHRIQRVCFETRMHTRSGRLPLVMRVTPTEVGVRALIWCRAGICAEDFELNAAEIAAACYAREARIEGNKRRAQLVTIHLVRHDPLAVHNVITPDLAPPAPARPAKDMP